MRKCSVVERRCVFGKYFGGRVLKMEREDEVKLDFFTAKVVFVWSREEDCEGGEFGRFALKRFLRF